ncbi:ABC transporter substrate-binding protein [Bradyrhizobium sp. DASA03007]|uniref:ABC transporter substrate-binding protein n=1 Tax=unclassified Bradyrhizobium TaxID=2631580 RepID=UPI003F727689
MGVEWLRGLVVTSGIVGASICMSIVAASSADLKIGFIGPLSGPVAVYGTEPLKASRLAVEEINASGVLGGDKLVLIPVDSAANPAQAAQAARRMVLSDDVLAIIGGHTSAETQAIVEATRNLKVPVLSTLAQAAELTAGENKWFVRICQNTDIWGRAVATWLKTKRQPKSIDMLGRNDGYGQSLQNAIAGASEQVGIKVLSKTNYDPNTKEFKPLLTAVKDSGSEFVVISGFYTDTALLVKQMNELGVTKPFFNNTAVAIPQYTEISGPAAEGTYGAVYYLPGSITGEQARRFVTSWTENNGKPPSQYEGMGYDGVNLLANAIQRAKAKGKLSRDTVRDALFETKDFAGVTGNITITQTGDVKRPLPIVQLKDGKIALEMLVD